MRAFFVRGHGPTAARQASLLPTRPLGHRGMDSCWWVFRRMNSGHTGQGETNQCFDWWVSVLCEELTPFRHLLGPMTRGGKGWENAITSWGWNLAVEVCVK